MDEWCQGGGGPVNLGDVFFENPGYILSIKKSFRLTCLMPL